MSPPPCTLVGATSACLPTLLPKCRMGPHQPCQSIKRENITPPLLLCPVCLFKGKVTNRVMEDRIHSLYIFKTRVLYEILILKKSGHTSVYKIHGKKTHLMWDCAVLILQTTCSWFLHQYSYSKLSSCMISWKHCNHLYFCPRS